MSMNLLDDELAITNAVRVTNKEFGIKFEYPGLPLKEYPPAMWGRVFNLRGLGQPATMGPEGYDEHTGVIQIDISVPNREGTATLLNKASEVANAFHAGQQIKHGEACLVLRSVSISPDRVTGNWRRVSISVSYIKRNQRV